MSVIEEANRLLRQGRYAKALDKLERMSDVANKGQCDLLKAELLVNVGRTDEARTTLRQAISGRRLSDGERGQVEFIESGLCVQTGDFDGQLHHLSRCVLQSEKANDLRRVCIAQLTLIGLTADKTGIDSVRALLASARVNINRLGDPSITAWMHICVAENDAKRGLLERSRMRLLMAVRLMEPDGNHDLMAWAYNNLLGVSVLQADFESAAEFGEKASLSISESGTFIAQACHLGNLGYLALLRGNFSEAIEILEKGINVSGAASEYASLHVRERRACSHGAGKIRSVSRDVGQRRRKHPATDRTGPIRPSIFGLDEGRSTRTNWSIF